MRKFSWYTNPVKVTDYLTVYQYAVNREILIEKRKDGSRSFILVKKGTYVTSHDGGWQRYKPNRKGGHTHNHIYNVCHRITFRSKSARHRVSREDKMRFVATFYTTLMLNPQVLGDILKRRKA